MRYLAAIAMVAPFAVYFRLVVVDLFVHVGNMIGALTKAIQ